MAQPAKLKRDTPPADAPDTAAAIDSGHLARMTFGDRDLERELLDLFDRQAAILIVRMRAGGEAALAPLAHTLKGSAASVGAAAVARAAQTAERASSPAECSRALDHLAEAIDQARACIAELLRER
jgi:HPt (histidine-containing phosphotransfer) domain-containing protein